MGESPLLAIGGTQAKGSHSLRLWGDTGGWCGHSQLHCPHRCSRFRRAQVSSWQPEPTCSHLGFN